jgi:hypothetical protein
MCEANIVALKKCSPIYKGDNEFLIRKLTPREELVESLAIAFEGETIRFPGGTDLFVVDGSKAGVSVWGPGKERTLPCAVIIDLISSSFSTSWNDTLL